MIRYLSGADTPGLAAVAHEYSVGLLIQPGNMRSYCKRTVAYPFWGGDNSCFTTKASGFDFWRYLEMLHHPLLDKSTCLFVNAPDVLTVASDGAVVGDAKATLRRFPMWGAIIRALGFPVALVAQDGLETILDDVPWADFDVLFIGGSDAFKLGDGAKACVDEAKRRGKRTHMGRVNSLKRLRLANGWGIDTADGTYLKFGPEKNLPKLLGWLRELEK